VIKLGWGTLVVATLIAAFVISMVATKEKDCPRRLGRGDTCQTTYWFNR
jgi:hypothetical protein